MKLTIGKHDHKWFALRRRLYGEGRCAQREKSKVAVFAALAERWKDRGISGSSGDWWTKYPNELFDLEFYESLVAAERAGEVSSYLLYKGFRPILDLVPPQGSVQRFWLLHGGAHKAKLLKALLGKEEYDRRADPNHWVLLFRVDWDLSLYLGSSRGLDRSERGKKKPPFGLSDVPGAEEIIDYLESDEDELEEDEDGPGGSHIADYWDGQIINCDEFEAFDKLWSKLCEVYEGLDDFYEVSKFYGRLTNSERVGFVDSVTDLLRDGTAAEEALCDLGKLVASEPVNTDGPLSGSGHHLYHENSCIVEELTKVCAEIWERGRKALERLDEENGENPRVKLATAEEWEALGLSGERVYSSFNPLDTS